MVSIGKFPRFSPNVCGQWLGVGRRRWLKRAPADEKLGPPHNDDGKIPGYKSELHRPIPQTAPTRKSLTAGHILIQTYR
jgi:hypothetical protein